MHSLYPFVHLSSVQDPQSSAYGRPKLLPSLFLVPNPLEIVFKLFLAGNL